MEIPGYKLGREVQAEPAFTVYNALDVEHSKTVIVRVFNEALSKDPAFQNHFRDVTERLVDQPLSNNVDYLDAIVTDDACVIVTNYCPRSALRQESFPDFSEEKVLDIGVQLAVSLSQLHKLGIVHGGVELSNISFRQSGEVVLETVAPQRTMPGCDAPGPISQSPQDAACLAPEAGTGLTASSDFFSLGVVLYELLLGRKPFNTDTSAELEQQKKEGRFLPLPGELVHLNPLFSRLLSPDPRSRIASDQQFISVLNACRKGNTPGEVTTPGNPASTDPASPTARPTAVASVKKTKRRPLVFAAVPAVLVAAAVVYYLVSGKQDTPQPLSDETQTPVVAETPAPTIDVPPLAPATDRVVEPEPDEAAVTDLENGGEEALETRPSVAAAEVPATDQRAADAAREAEEREKKERALAAIRRAEVERAEQERAERRRTAALAEQRRLERERIAREEEAERIAREEEAERIAREEEAERLAAQQLEIAARNAEISQRLTTAEQQLTTRPLSWSALETAESEYRMLLTITDDDSRVSGLYRDIVDSHLVLANSQRDAGQLSDSLETTNRGLALDGENRDLLALRNEIAAAIKKLEEEEEEVPIIGTF